MLRFECKMEKKIYVRKANEVGRAIDPRVERTKQAKERMNAGEVLFRRRRKSSAFLLTGIRPSTLSKRNEFQRPLDDVLCVYSGLVFRNSR